MISGATQSPLERNITTQLVFFLLKPKEGEKVYSEDSKMFKEVGEKKDFLKK